MGFYVPEIGGFMQNIQIVYSACVLASSGGIQGGLLLSNKSPESLSQTILRYSLSILPPVLGISTLIIPTIIQLDPLYTQVVQLAGLNLTLIGEFLLNHTGLPAPWYLKLRFWLTGAASLCIGVMIYSELKWAGRIIPPPLKMSF
ncbi:hypothetical protein HK098_002851 [Nowakowskiella sp. JEL0407]|nr:hypothetical protein HK098_002851 [Nowakowskiella sp. JEL0407]